MTKIERFTNFLTSIIEYPVQLFLFYRFMKSGLTIIWSLCVGVFVLNEMSQE